MTPELALFILLVLLQLLDFHTKATVLALGGKELNPIMRWLFNRVGVEEALILKGMAVLFVVGALALDSALVLGVIDAAYVVVIAWNYRSMPK